MNIDPPRTLTQNAKMWPMLRDFAKHADWSHTVGGEWTTAKMKEHHWKAVLTAAFEGETGMAAGLHGGIVMVGASTSDYSKRRMAEFIDFMYAEGTDRGVTWSEKSLEMVREYGTALRRAA